MEHQRPAILKPRPGAAILRSGNHEIPRRAILAPVFQYAEILLEEHASYIPGRDRATIQEAENFKEEQNPSQPPDQSNPEHLSWTSLVQKMIGALLWLSTRTRPDLSCAVSLASQALFKHLKKLKDRLRHLLQYIK